MIFQKLKSSYFIKNTATLIGGTTIAQALPLLFAPVISRLFLPEDFSLYGIFISIYAIAGSAITLKYERAIMLPVDDNEAKEIVTISLINSFVFSIFLFIILFLFKSPIASMFPDERIEQYLLLVPIAAFFLAANNTLINWFNRIQKYKTIASNKIVRNTLLTGFNLGTGFALIGAIGLIISQIISDGIAVSYYFYIYLKNALQFKFTFRFKTLKQLASRYKEFPLFALPATFIDTISMQLPLLMIATLFSQSLSGNYFFAYRILILPVSLIGAAFAQTFYQTFVAHIQQRHYSIALSFLKKSWLLLFAIIIMPAIVLMFWGTPIFTYVFGAEWTESGRIASILIFYMMFSFISSPTSTTYIALDMQKYNLIFSTVVCLYRFSTIYTGYLLNDFYLGLKLLVVCEFIQIAVYNSVIYLRLNKMQKQL